MSAWAVLAMAAVVCAAARADNIESPPYSVVHAESDFEIRLYRPSTWISTPVEDISFNKATQIGFHKYAHKPYPRDFLPLAAIEQNANGIAFERVAICAGCFSTFKGRTSTTPELK